MTPQNRQISPVAFWLSKLLLSLLRSQNRKQLRSLPPQFLHPQIVRRRLSLPLVVSSSKSGLTTGKDSNRTESTWISFVQGPIRMISSILHMVSTRVVRVTIAWSAVAVVEILEAVLLRYLKRKIQR